jgi:hypothetical protein
VDWLGVDIQRRQRRGDAEEASGVIANGYLRLDREEWVRAVEKRRAALGAEL